MEEDNIEIIDPQTFEFSKEVEFSHPATVMKSYMRCLETGAKEMTKGYWEQKTDKSGNLLRTYHPDTRLEFINSVKTLRINLISNFDSEAKQKIDSIISALEAIRKQMEERETQWFNSKTFQQRMQIAHIDGYLNQDLPFYQQYINDEVEAYREMFEELEKLLERTKYLKKKLVIA